MKQKKKSIAVIWGGEGKERSISERSKDALISYIDKKLYTVWGIEITADGKWYIDNAGVRSPVYPKLGGMGGGFYTDGGIAFVPDCSFIILHGDMGEDGTVQGLLSSCHIPYLGQTVYSCALSHDKIYTKIIAEHLGIPTVPWLEFNGEPAEYARTKAEDILGYPMFIKPARLGSSIGAAPVPNEKGFACAYEQAVKLSDGRILIEKLADIEFELEAAVLIDGGEVKISAGTVATDGVFYGFEEKYSKNTRTDTYIPSTDDGEKVNEYTKLLVDALGIKYFSRVDFFKLKSGDIVFNEVNTVPGMTSSSLYPRLTENLGLKKGEFINVLIDGFIRERQMP